MRVYSLHIHHIEAHTLYAAQLEMAILSKKSTLSWHRAGRSTPLATLRSTHPKVTSTSRTVGDCRLFLERSRRLCSVGHLPHFHPQTPACFWIMHHRKAIQLFTHSSYAEAATIDFLFSRRNKIKVHTHTAATPPGGGCP